MLCRRAIKINPPILYIDYEFYFHSTILKKLESSISFQKPYYKFFVQIRTNR
jgi:hypothetical protein